LAEMAAQMAEMRAQMVPPPAPRMRRASAPKKEGNSPAGIPLLASMRQLPAEELARAYGEARVALAGCELAESLRWVAEAVALAAYARREGRLRLRAVVRQGELLPGIPAATNQHNAANGSGRYAAAKAAGLSSHQTTTALHIHAVPEAKREALIESEYPPTVTALAERGAALARKL